MLQDLIMDYILIPSTTTLVHVLQATYATALKNRMHHNPSLRIAINIYYSVFFP